MQASAGRRHARVGRVASTCLAEILLLELRRVLHVDGLILDKAHLACKERLRLLDRLLDEVACARASQSEPRPECQGLAIF